MAQTVTVEVDWTSKSGAADATIAFGETFDLQITGVSNFVGSIRMALLSQSVSDDDAVLWIQETATFDEDGGTITISGIRFRTTKVYDVLKAQGGKAKLYLSVLNVRGEETVTDEEGNEKQIPIVTDYGVARITLTLGSYLENGPIPEDFEPDTMTIGELQEFLTQVKFDTQFYRNEAEQFKNSALSYSNMASNFSTSAASSAGHASTFAIEAAASAESAQSILTETTAVAATVASQAEVCAKAQEVVVSKTVEVEELHSAVTNLVGDIDRIEDIVENLDEIVETETPKIEAAASTAQAAATTAQQMVDSINYSFETWSDASVVDGNFIGPAKKDGVQPRFHNRNKDIHGVTGFSGDTYHNARFLFDWRLAMSNNQSYLASYACWTADRKLGGGTVTFSQPLMPPNEGTDTRFPYAIPNFENSPLFWSGHFVYNEPNANGEYTTYAKQIKLDWSKVSAGGEGTIALMSDVEAVSERVTAIEEGVENLTPNESVFDVVAVSTNTIILDANKAYYAKTLTESEYTFAIDASGLTLDDKIAKINLLLSIGTVEPTITFPASVNFIDEVQFSKASQTMLELTSIDQGASWIAKVKFSCLAYAYEVEYIEATGTQYLNTGTAPLKASYSFEGVFLNTNTSKGNLFGVTQTGTGIANAINNQTSMYFRAFSTNAALFRTVTVMTAFHTYGYNGSNFYILDGNGAECAVSQGSNEKTSDADITSPITLFFRNNTANSFGCGRCKSFWIKDENGDLLLDLIPVVSREGEACMYDRVSAQLIKSATADAFVAGPRVD